MDTQTRNEPEARPSGDLGASQGPRPAAPKAPPSGKKRSREANAALLSALAACASAAIAVPAAVVSIGQLNDLKAAQKTADENLANSRRLVEAASGILAEARKNGPVLAKQSNATADIAGSQQTMATNSGRAIQEQQIARDISQRIADATREQAAAYVAKAEEEKRPRLTLRGVDVDMHEGKKIIFSVRHENTGKYDPDEVDMYSNNVVIDTHSTPNNLTMPPCGGAQTIPYTRNNNFESASSRVMSKKEAEDLDNGKSVELFYGRICYKSGGSYAPPMIFCVTTATVNDVKNCLFRIPVLDR